MLAGNFGSFSPRFNTTPAGEANWRWMAHNYGAIALNGEESATMGACMYAMRQSAGAYETQASR